MLPETESGWFFFKLALARAPHPIRPTRRGPDPNRPMYDSKERGLCMTYGVCSVTYLNPMGTGNYSATSNNMKLVHWLVMGGLLHFVQQEGDWAGL